MCAAVAKQNPVAAPDTLRAVLDHQQALVDARTEVARITDLIASFEVKGKFDDSDLRAAKEARGKVLADIALGTADESDLQAADRRIAEIDIELHEQRRSARLAKETTDALQPRLHAARLTLSQLEARSADILADHLRALIEEEAARFDKWVSKAGDHYRLVLAYEEMLGEHYLTGQQDGEYRFQAGRLLEPRRLTIDPNRPRVSDNLKSNPDHAVWPPLLGTGIDLKAMVRSLLEGSGIDFHTLRSSTS